MWCIRAFQACSASGSDSCGDDDDDAVVDDDVDGDDDDVVVFAGPPTTLAASMSSSNTRGWSVTESNGIDNGSCGDDDDDDDDTVGVTLWAQSILSASFSPDKARGWSGSVNRPLPLQPLLPLLPLPPPSPPNTTVTITTTGGRNSSVGSAWARCSQRRGFDPPLGTFSGIGDFFLGVNMGSNSIPPKTPSDESINRGLVCAHMHFIAGTQKILTFMS